VLPFVAGVVGEPNSVVGWNGNCDCGGLVGVDGVTFQGLCRGKGGLVGVDGVTFQGLCRGKGGLVGVDGVTFQGLCRAN
jgi:hypothetical protein